jgi:hypothetical protein
MGEVVVDVGVLGKRGLAHSALYYGSILAVFYIPQSQAFPEKSVSMAVEPASVRTGQRDHYHNYHLCFIISDTVHFYKRK